MSATAIAVAYVARWRELAEGVAGTEFGDLLAGERTTARPLPMRTSSWCSGPRALARSPSFVRADSEEVADRLYERPNSDGPIELICDPCAPTRPLRGIEGWRRRGDPPGPRRRANDAGRPSGARAAPERSKLTQRRGRSSGSTFHYDAPSNRAPQSAILAVPPQIVDRPWSLDVIAGTVREAFDLARLRGVTLHDVPAVGSVLPALYLPSDPTGNIPSVPLDSIARAKLKLVFGKD